MTAAMNGHGWVYWTLTTAYVLTILSVIGVVISENRNPVKSLAWVTVLLVVPLAGLVFYVLFGRNIQNKRFISRRNKRKLRRNEIGGTYNKNITGLSECSVQQIRLGQMLTGAPYYGGNSAMVFTGGGEKFRQLCRDLRAATQFIYLQYYIFSDDATGTLVADILEEKARNGVAVKVIYDHVGSFKTSRRFIRRLRDAGVEIYPFFKVTFPFLGSRINWRNHRKIVIIDGRVGYIGGMNIADRYIDGKGYGGWRDIHLRIKGPILRSLNFSFSSDWNFMGRPLPEEFNPEMQSPGSEDLGMQLITSGPVNQWNNIGLTFLKAIGNAKKSIYLQTPYFLPTEALLRALQAAALSKIDVRIMIPRRPDSRMMRFASASYIKECLQAGIKFYFYEKGMLHSKMLIIDDEMVSIGSTNFDFRSFEHNFESNLFVYSSKFNAQMTDIFMEDIEDSTRVAAASWKKRPVTQKAAESLMRLLSPIL